MNDYKYGYQMDLEIYAGGFHKITEKEFNDICDYYDFLLHNIWIEEKFDILVENYMEIEKDLFELYNQIRASNSDREKQKTICTSAITLFNFQVFFSNMAMSSVPNFIVYDQPSQVYFPQKLAAKENDKDIDPKLDDEDRIAVEKIFKTMASAITMANKPMQIIVLEHADESVWENVEKIHEVCVWRGENQKSIPEEWIC